MSDIPTSPARKPRRWPLYVSLFVNVVLITILAITAWRIYQVRQPSAADGIGPWMPRQVERVLPAEARAKVARIREAHRDEFRPLFENARESRNAVRQALAQEPFEAEKLSAALRAMREADAAIAVATAGVVVEIATVLSPEERMLVRKSIRERRGGPRGDRVPGGPPPGEPPPGEGPPPGAEDFPPPPLEGP